eukprot:CAMPEP_0116147252 /NCGR_PEP_ID=MMETSP0329-20121206/17649_1 /TAXON_ID=697910 /ORGANISM="Pseudo-nitzschia arenysensis, Strain B593" /LENGTH=332 /DNA_ID=CAMNT_0003643155 /DNA_START=103 /DNA_END=1101 /DNA_ORIENTATION=-
MIYRLIVLLVVLGQFSEGFVTIEGAGSVSNFVSTATAQRLTRSPTRSSTFAALTPPTVIAFAKNTVCGLSHQDNCISSTTATTAATATATTSTTRSSLSNGKASFNLLARFPPRGGASVQTQSTSTSTSTSLFASSPGGVSSDASGCPFTKFMTSFGAFWGSFGVIYILARAITRVLPMALEPFSYQADLALVLSPLQWCSYALSCFVFAYAEGYKGFHKKFAPLVVKRSFTLIIGTRQGNNPLNYFLAPLYSMGLWGATKKRLIVSWGVTTGVALLVAIVKKLPQAPRCILDAGVVVGLTIGSASILYHFARSLVTGKLPDVDACLPNETS